MFIYLFKSKHMTSSNLFLGIFLLLIVILIGFACTPKQNGDKVLSPKLFQKAVTVPNIQLIDVRTPEEYQSGHLKDAINMDFYANDFEAKIAQLDKTKTVYVYCRSGGRSAKSAKQFEKLGFTEVYDLQGGITAWKSQNLPVIQ